MDDHELCWEILPKVSRSFALCIKMLPRPIDEQMMLSYMLYRAIDTIEDSHASLRTKRALFKQLLATMTLKAYSPRKIAACKTALLTKINYTYEVDLLQNMEALMRVFYAQPPEVRRAIARWGKVMASGMYEFQNKGISTFGDQNRYSFYVAGVVGYLFNDLFYYNKVITLQARRRLHAHAKRFGLALQKVNILRDVSHDITQGRYYWPKALLKKYGLTYENLCDESNRKAAMKVLKAEIDNALEYLYSGMYYVLSLPESAIQVRIFCLIPLFMAIESYVQCIDNTEIFATGKTVKISRLQVQGIVAKCMLWANSNKQLHGWFMHSMTKAKTTAPKSASARALLKMNIT